MKKGVRFIQTDELGTPFFYSIPFELGSSKW